MKERTSWVACGDILLENLERRPDSVGGRRVVLGARILEDIRPLLIHINISCRTIIGKNRAIT